VRDADELCELLGDLVALDPDDPVVEPAWLAELVQGQRASLARLPDGRGRLFSAERSGEISALFPQAKHEPELVLPAHLAPSEVTYEEALDAAVRGHLAVSGPVTADALVRRIAVSPAGLPASLARLEGRGIALRGSFDLELAGEQFCDRSLLARIHRYTLARLRREIEPVSARDYLSFLLRWQHVDPESQLLGESGTLQAIECLAGFEAPAATWESDLLPVRVDGYKPALLDALCLGGAVAWGRLSAPASESAGQPTRVTPIALFPRGEFDVLLHCAALDRGEEGALHGTAERILELLRARGALFAREVEASRLGLPVQIEDGLRELVARGRITCDGFAPLRRLISGRRRGGRGRPLPGARTPLYGVSAAEGRWSLLSAIGEAPDLESRAEATAERLLRRYGVVFRDVLAREWVPDGWRHVHRALRRLEARGLVRGGRFVSGFMGEQFALPEAIPLLREARRREPGDNEIRVSASDPLNLAGVLTPGPRVPAGHTRWLVYRGGLPVAAIERGRRHELTPPTPLTQDRGRS
jgi:ATP-dependent Lhr-like helicase